MTSISPSVLVELPKLLSKAYEDGIQKLVVGAVISRDKKILLLQRAPDEFMPDLVEFPSGGVEKDESLTDALSREVKEETGLDVLDILSYIGSFDYISGSGKTARQLNFLVTASDSPIVLNPAEHSAYYLVEPGSDEYERLNISDESKEIIGKLTLK